ncbi:hypothetical protein [Nocardia farcinica]|uniref:hypothetical protein n=1 Tax=Nocardia farcinica TaxID=37329 RepID=UPI003CC7D977
MAAAIGFALAATGPAGATSELDRYLDLPQVNRDAAAVTGLAALSDPLQDVLAERHPRRDMPLFAS